MLTRHTLRRCTAAITLSIGLVGQTAFAADDIIKIGYHDGPQQFNPAYALASSTVFVLNNVYETLIREGNRSGFTGGLAKRWQVSDDARIYDFWLRENASWSDGTPIDASYAAESFRFLGTLPDNANFIDFSEIDIRVEQDENGQEFLRFVLPEPSSQFFPYLAFVSTAILPIHKSDEVDFASRWDRFDAGPQIYSGAYTLSHVDASGEQITLRPNPAYHSAQDVMNDGINMVFLEDQDLKAISALQSGELDIVPHRASGQSSYIDETMQEYLRKIDYPSMDMLRLNLDQPALQDPTVRRAIAKISRLAEAESFLSQNNLHVSGTFVPTQLQASLDYPTIPLYHPSDETAFAEAREAMRSLGYGSDNLLKINFAVNASVAHERMANLMGARLRQIFIDANIVVRPWGEHLKMLEERNFEIARYGWRYQIPHPHYLFKIFMTDHQNNYEGYSNPEYDKVVEAMDHTFSNAKLAALIEEAEAILRRDVPAIPLYQRNDSLLAHPDLALGEHNFAGQLHFDQIHWRESDEAVDQS